MRTETIERKLYSFAELDDGAKEKARDGFRQGIESEELANTDDWLAIAAILGIEFETHDVRLYGGGTRKEPSINWSGFSSQGDGASFVGWYSYAKGAPAAIRAHAPLDERLHRIADGLQEAQRHNFYRLQASITAADSRYSHSGSMRVNVSRTDDRDPSAYVEDAVLSLMRDFADWIYRQLELQWDYLHSEEAVDESIAANEYEFTEDGSIA